MRFYSKKDEVAEKGTPETASPVDTPARGNSHTVVTRGDLEPTGRVPAVAIILGAVASIGGFMFGSYCQTVHLFGNSTDFGFFQAMNPDRFQGSSLCLISWNDLAKMACSLQHALVQLSVFSRKFSMYEKRVPNLTS